MRALFVMDPLSTIHVDKDSSYVLMLEWRARGGEVWHCLPGDLFARGGSVFARASRILPGPKPEVGDVVEVRDLDVTTCDVVWKRTDPPFDMRYVFSTYLLDLIEHAGIPVVNAPRGLRDANEKMVILRFPDLVVETLVTRDIARIRAFVDDMGGRAVVKPWDGNGGRGIFVLERGDRNFGSMVETSTREGRDYVLVQRYIPEVRQGDKRILLVDGEPRGAFLRIPADDDHRGNMHAGASVEACDLTDRDLEICRTLKPYLVANGLLFTGIDVIGRFLTEVNVTSPTGIQECTRLYGTNIAADAVSAALARRKP